MGSDKKLGMSWTQLKEEGRDAFEAAKSISKHLPDLYFNMQEDFKARATIFIFHSVSDAQQLMEKYIIYGEKKVEFYQTVRYEENGTIIDIPSYRGCRYYIPHKINQCTTGCARDDKRHKCM
ncbi:hypothetical protein AYI68_g2967, partial [Smittium mucronatum]